MKRNRMVGMVFICLMILMMTLTIEVGREKQGLAQEASSLKGIDVSAHQHKDLQGKTVSIEWPKVYAKDYKFAFVKATQGTTYSNPYFSTDMVEGRKANILMGAYHFGEPNLYLEKEELVAQAENEARYFLRATEDHLKEDDLRPVLDIEDASKNYPFWGVHYYNPSTGELLWNIDAIAKKLGPKETKERISSWIRKWIEIVSEKAEPILYVNHNFAENYLEESLNKYALWFAWPTGQPDNPPLSSFLGIWEEKGWDFWQYSWQGLVQGIKSKYVDLDLFNGDLSKAYTFTIAPTITPPPPVACPPEGEPKFSQGQEVITTDDGLRVREKPSLAAEIIKTQLKGTSGKILEGPVCADNYVWWKVEYEDGTIGWSAQDWMEVSRIKGEKIAYISSTSELYIVNSDGTNQRKLPAKSVMNFEWLPDGKRILYNRVIMYPEGVFLINVETGEEKKVLDGESFMELSPDGKKFLYWEGKFPEEILAIFDIETQSSKILPLQQTYTKTEFGTFIGVNSLTWSPDSKKIAYIDHNYVDQRGLRGSAVWVMNLETLEKEMLLEFVYGSLGSPRFLSWSSENNKIYLLRTLIRQGIGTFTFEVIDIDLKTTEEIFGINFGIGSMVSCPILWDHTLPNLFAIHESQGEPKVILSFTQDCLDFSSALFPVQPALAGPGLWLFEKGKDPKRLSELFSYSGVDISPDGNWIVFESQGTIYTVDIEGGNLKKIAESGSNPSFVPK